MARFRRPVDLTIAGVLVSSLVGCQTSPTGRQQIVLVPENEVEQMGTQAFQDLKTKQPIDTSAGDNTYVQCIANAITHTVDPQKKWEVVVFQSDQVNAFALPGGKIGVYSGLLKVANTPGELAAVIGHEVGHVIAQHGRERASQQLLTQGLVTGASAMFQNRGSTTYQMVMAGLGVGAQVGVLLPFSRAQESEADLIGLQLMAKSGFDPHQAIELWKNMSKAGGNQPPQLLSDHPANENRIEQLAAHLDEAVLLYQNAGSRPSCQK